MILGYEPTVAFAIATVGLFGLIHFVLYLKDDVPAVARQAVSFSTAIVMASVVLVLSGMPAKAQNLMSNLGTDVKYSTLCLTPMGSFKQHAAQAECRLLRNGDGRQMWESLWEASQDAIDTAQRETARKLWLDHAKALGVGELPRSLNPVTGAVGGGRLGLSNAGRLLNDALVQRIENCVRESSGCPPLKAADWQRINATLALLDATKSSRAHQWRALRSVIPGQRI
jgi:hypothetical protein